MKIAIPLANGKLCMHFGHCEQFGIYETEGKNIVNKEMFTPPPHEPGLYPRLLAEKKVNVILSGGMGQNARNMFLSNNIRVLTGVYGEMPEDIINDYLNDDLKTGANACDH